jgi:hypothetical protein
VDSHGNLDDDFVWHDLAQVWISPGSGEEFMEMILGASVKDRADMLTAAGIPESGALDMATGIDTTMAAAILSLYRSAVDIGSRWGPGIDQITGRGLIIDAANDAYGTTRSKARLGERTGARVAPLASTLSVAPTRQVAPPSSVSMPSSPPRDTVERTGVAEAPVAVVELEVPLASEPPSSDGLEHAASKTNTRATPADGARPTSRHRRVEANHRAGRRWPRRCRPRCCRSASAGQPVACGIERRMDGGEPMVGHLGSPRLVVNVERVSHGGPDALTQRR